MTYITTLEQTNGLSVFLVGQRERDAALDLRWQYDPEYMPHVVLRVTLARDGIVDIKIARIVDGVPETHVTTGIVVHELDLHDTAANYTFMPRKGDTVWLYQRGAFGFIRGIVFWRVNAKAKKVVAYCSGYKTLTEQHAATTQAAAARREAKILEAERRAVEFAERTKRLPELFQQKIAHDRAADPVGYPLDFEATQLDIYEVAVDMCTLYTANTQKAEKTLSSATPESVYRRVPSAKVLEPPQVLDALAFAYELLTGEEPEWSGRGSEES